MTDRFVAEHFNPRGLPKRAFDTQDEAVRFRNETPGMKSKSTYECGVCGKWHLGKLGKNRGRKRRGQR